MYARIHIFEILSTRPVNKPSTVADYGLGSIPTHPAQGWGLRLLPTPQASVQCHPVHPAHSVPQAPMGDRRSHHGPAVSARLQEESEFHSATSSPPLCVVCHVGGCVFDIPLTPQSVVTCQIESLTNGTFVWWGESIQQSGSSSAVASQDQFLCRLNHLFTVIP